MASMKMTKPSPTGLTTLSDQWLLPEIQEINQRFNENGKGVSTVLISPVRAFTSSSDGKILSEDGLWARCCRVRGGTDDLLHFLLRFSVFWTLAVS